MKFDLQTISSTTRRHFLRNFLLHFNVSTFIYAILGPLSFKKLWATEKVLTKQNVQNTSQISVVTDVMKYIRSPEVYITPNSRDMIYYSNLFQKISAYLLCKKLKSQPINLDHYIIVDYTLDSKENRFFIFNKKNEIIFKSLASHAIYSGNSLPTDFSNQINSMKSSRGIILTGGKYNGNFGLSITLHGLEDINHNLYKRNIVIHQANYSSLTHIKKYNHLGRSLGCIALPKQISSQKMIEKLPPRTFIFVIGKDLVNEAEPIPNLNPPTSEEKLENKIK